MKYTVKDRGKIMTQDKDSEVVLTANGFTEAEEQEILRISEELILDKSEPITIEEFLSELEAMIDED